MTNKEEREMNDSELGYIAIWLSFSIISNFFCWIAIAWLWGRMGAKD
jgi:hypothetical protein